MVGFPDETQNDYQETIDMMEKIRFDSVFSFRRWKNFQFKGQLELIGKLMGGKLLKTHLQSLKGKWMKEVGNVN